jgi:hypothetical protein
MLEEFIKDKHKATPEEAVEDVYGLIKVFAKEGYLRVSDLKDIIDLTTELYNRLKVEESCGEQKG